MKVVFVVSAFESIAVENLSAFLKQHGHATDLAFDPQIFDNVFLKQPVLARIFSYRGPLLDQIRDAQPDLLAFSVTGFDLPWAWSVAGQAKSRLNVPVVFGGAHALICPDKLMENPCVDYVVRGEGEQPLLDIIARIRNGPAATPLPNTWFRHDGDIVKGEMQPPAYSLDDLPFPDKGLFYAKLKHLYGYTMNTSRACTRGCAYCFYNVVKQKYYAPWMKRRNSVGYVLAQLRRATADLPVRTVRFYDNDFAEDPRWVAEFAQGYKRDVDLPYHVQSHPDALTPDVIEQLAQSGCFEVQLGVQSVNPRTRAEIGRTEPLEQVARVIDDLRRAGIRCCTDILMGLPGENADDVLEAGKFLNRHRPTKINIFWLDYIPYSRISRLGRDKGVLSDDDIKIIDDSRWMAGLFTGGKTRSANRPMMRMQMLLTLLPLVSRRTLDRIIERRIYRLFPTRFGPPVFWILVSALIHHPNDMHRIRYARLHREFFFKIFYDRLRSRINALRRRA